MGYDPVLFERGSIPYGNKVSLADNCYKEIEACDIVVSIIGGRYGTQSNYGQYSITQSEIKKAIEKGKQVFIFIDRNVWSEYSTYQLNRENNSIKYSHVDDTRVFEFIAEISKLPKNNPIFPFILPKDIIETLKEQLSGLFQRLTHDESNRSHIDIISSLSDTTDVLKKTIQYIIDRNKESFVDILLTNHPIFYKVRNLLGIDHRIFFTNLEELNELLLVYEFLFDDTASKNSKELVWLKRDAVGLFTKVGFNRSLFDGNDKLIPEHGHSWSNDLVSWEENWFYF